MAALSIDIPLNEPVELRAGDTWAWRREDLSDYPAPTWVLTYQLKREVSGGNASIVAAASGTYHAVSVAKATTAGYAKGIWHWQAYVDNGASRYLVDRGTFNILPDFAVAGDLDNRTHVKKTLDAIEAVIEGRATSDQQSYTIMGRSLTRIPIAELMVFREKYKAEYSREVNAEAFRNGLGAKNRIVVRF